MQILDFVLDAATIVLDWDIPEDGYSEAITAQACQLAGPDADDAGGDNPWLH